MADIQINAAFMPFFRSRARYQMLKGGRGGGKSHHAALKMVLGILGIDPLTWEPTTNHFRGVLVRETFDSIRDSQYKEICDLIEKYGLHSRIEIGKTPLGFYCPATGFNIIAKGVRKSRNSSESTFKSVKDPTFVWIEELPDMPYEDFKKVTMSVRAKGSDCQIVCTHNTDIEPDHWVRKYFYDTVRDDTFYLHTTYKNNIANLNDDAVKDYEQLKFIDPEAYSVEVLGEWGNKKVERPFASAFDEARHVAPCSFLSDRPLYISFDFNIDPFAAIFYHYWRDTDGHHFHVFDEETIQGGTVDEMCNRINAKYGNKLGSVTITGDYNGNNQSMSAPDKASAYQLIKRNLRLRDTNFDLRANPRHTNSREDCNYFLHNFEDFRIDPNCVNLARDLRTVEVNAEQKIVKQNRQHAEQRADHLDAWRYAVNGRDVQRWIKETQKRK
jgi:PBSX family phage terminase large subunit